MIATYGGHGGDRCAPQLRQVLEALSMKPIATMPGLKLSRAHIEANTGEVDAACAFALDIENVQQAFAELDIALSPSVSR